jgi:integrase
MTVLEARNRRWRILRVAGFQWLYEPGDRLLEDGTRVIATERSAIYIKDGKVVREEENDRKIIPTYRFDPAEVVHQPRRKTTGNADDQIVDTWIKHRGISGNLERDARNTWDTFKRITDNKPLRECARDDGRTLVDHFRREGRKGATIQKKVGFLNAAVNLAIDEGKLRFNPFSRIVPKLDDEADRLPMDDADMQLVRENFRLLDDEEQCLWVLLATTGMRRGEAWDITREYLEFGIRYVIVGSKTEASLRRLPLPDPALAFLPAKITGQLFKATPKTLGRRLLRRIRKIGISDKAKVLHSLRHRAKDVLRANACPEDVQDWLLGHNQVTVSDDYGKGPPVTILKPWVDRIGW